MEQPVLREPKAYVRCQMSAPDPLVAIGGQVIVFSDRCPTRSNDNEDAAAVLPSDGNNGVLVVADGMGGGAMGEQASQCAIESMRDEVRDANRPGAMLRSAILNGIESANQRIRDFGNGAATTLAAVEIQDGVMRPYHVGDSSILVVGQRGKIKLQTVAHGPVSMAVEAGVLDDVEAMTHEDRHLVTNVVGTADMRIEIGPAVRLARYDTLIVASDGLFDNLSAAGIIERIRKGPLLQSIALLVDDVQQSMAGKNNDCPGKPDDLTIVAYRRN